MGMAARKTPSRVLVLSASLAACHGGTQAAEPRNKTVENSAPSPNKQAVRRLFEDGFNNNDAAAIERLVSADYVDGGGERGPAALQQVMTRLHAAFPDIHYTVESLVAEGDEVAVRWHWSGTHRGVFRGVAPTARSLTNSGIGIFRVRDGKITAASLETDRLGFLQGIGLLPSADVLFSAPAASATPAQR